MEGLHINSLVVLILVIICARVALTQEDDDDEYNYEEYDEDYDEDYEDYGDYEYDDYDTQATVTRAPSITTTKMPWWLTTTMARRHTGRPTQRVEYITPGPTVRKSVYTPRPDTRRDIRREPNRSGDRTNTLDRTKPPTRSRYNTVTISPTRSRYDTHTRSPSHSRNEAVSRASQRTGYNTARAAETRSTRSRYGITTKATTTRPRSRYNAPTTRSSFDKMTPSSSELDRRNIQIPRTRYVGTTPDGRYQRQTPRSRYATTVAPRYDARRQTQTSRQRESRYDSNRSDTEDDDIDQDSGDCGCEAVQELRSANDKLKTRLERIEKTLGDLGETVVKVELDSANWKRSLRFPGLTSIKNPSNIILKDDVISDRKYKDCQDVKLKGNNKPGVYGIMPDNSAFTTYAYCQDGWTFLQRRYDGSIPFNRKYDEYVKGFGNFSSEFWLGLENMHQLTTQKSYTLRIDMETSNTKFYYAMYNGFRIDNESESYRLYYGNMTAGNLGDGLVSARGRPFSTRDRDRDNWGYGNCAQFYHSGFWLDRCGTDLNRIPKLGKYGGMRWDRQVVVTSLMRIKPTRDLQPNELKLVP